MCNGGKIHHQVLTTFAASERFSFETQNFTAILGFSGLRSSIPCVVS